MLTTILVVTTANLALSIGIGLYIMPFRVR